MPDTYDYYQCGTCRAGQGDIPSQGPYRVAILRPTLRVVAQTLCAKCRRPMAVVGSGLAHLPPPGDFLHLTVNPVDPRDHIVHQGGGIDTTGRNIAFSVIRNEAEGRYRIEITCDRTSMNASLTLNQIQAEDGPPSEWIVKPPFSSSAGSAWATLDFTALDRVKSLRYPTGAIPLPSRGAIEVKLGTHYFGLIHLLAGHYQNTRTWIGSDNPTRVPDIAMPTALQAAAIAAIRAEQESYRTIQGIQRALGDGCRVSAIQRIVQAPQGKYLIYGLVGQLPAQIVVQRRVAEFSLTTLYINNAFSRDQPLRTGEQEIWRRLR